MLVTETGSVDLSVQSCPGCGINKVLSYLSAAGTLTFKNETPAVVSDWKRFPKELRVHMRKPLRDGQYRSLKHSQYSEYSEYR